MSDHTDDKSRKPRTSVLITGAGGYIGALVTETLAADPRGLQTIVAMDVREVPAGRRLEGVSYEVMDVRSPGIAGLIQRHGIDTVVHLVTLIGTSDADRELEYDVDVNGTRNLLQACAAQGVRKLIVTSSGAAYGYHADNAPLLDESAPLRGNVEFPYSHHKRLVEEMLARYREDHPELEQLVLRPGTVLGQSTENPITQLLDKRIIVGVAGSATPFVIIWDRDVAAVIAEGVHGERTGIFNLAGDGVITLREMAARLKKPYVPLPASLIEVALGQLKRLGWSRYGPEQVPFLRYRPVLSNERLKREFGYAPRLSTREVFDLYCEAREARV